MGRIRTLKPELPASETLGSVSREARLCFILLLTVADDEGRLAANHRVLAGALYPFDDDARELIPAWLNELERVGCIQTYVADGKSYAHIIGWSKHQRIDRPSKSRLPAPPALADLTINEASTSKREESADTREPSANPRESSQSDPRSLDAGPRTLDLGPKETFVVEADQSEVEKAGSKLPNCPYQQVVELYHQHLPELPAVRILDSKPRLQGIQKRWRWVLASTRPDGSRRATTAEEALGWFGHFFQHARNNDFLMGRVERTGPHANWRCDLDFLMTDRGLMQVAEKTEVPA